MKKIANRFLHPFSFVIVCLGLTSAPYAFGMEPVDAKERTVAFFRQKAQEIAEQTKQNNEFALLWNAKIQGAVGDLHRATQALTKLAAAKEEAEAKATRLTMSLEQETAKVEKTKQDGVWCLTLLEDLVRDTRATGSLYRCLERMATQNSNVKGGALWNTCQSLIAQILSSKTEEHYDDDDDDDEAALAGLPPAPDIDSEEEGEERNTSIPVTPLRTDPRTAARDQRVATLLASAKK